MSEDEDYNFDTYGYGGGDDYGDDRGGDYGDDQYGDDQYGDEPIDGIGDGGDDEDVFAQGDFKDSQRTGVAGGQPKGTSKLLQRMMREPHEKLWFQIKPLLKECIKGKINDYEEVIKIIPRVEYLNPPLLASALCYIAAFGKNLTQKTLRDHLSGETGIDPIDLIRYVKMVSTYM